MRPAAGALALLACIAVGGVVQQDQHEAHAAEADGVTTYTYICTVTLHDNGEARTDCTDK